MSEPVKRRSLLGGLDTPPAAPTVRRKRQPIGRIHQFNVRLRAETLGAIYTQANERNVPIAQVIEEAMAALVQKAGE